MTIVTAYLKCTSNEWTGTIVPVIAARRGPESNRPCKESKAHPPLDQSESSATAPTFTNRAQIWAKPSTPAMEANQLFSYSAAEPPALDGPP